MHHAAGTPGGPQNWSRWPRGLRGADEASWAGMLERHFSDLRAAHSWLTGQDTELSLRMVAQLHWYALWRCQSEVFRWADVSTAAAVGLRSPFYSNAVASAAIGAVYRGDMQAADTAKLVIGKRVSRGIRVHGVFAGT